jgi:hypothetical protein
MLIYQPESSEEEGREGELSIGGGNHSAFRYGDAVGILYLPVAFFI